MTDREIRELQRLSRRQSSSGSSEAFSPPRVRHDRPRGRHHDDRDRDHRDVYVSAQHCNVIKYKRAGPMPIRTWIYNMENWFALARIPEEQWVRALIANVHAQHFEEIKAYRKQPYPIFRLQLLNLFKEPDLKDAFLRELFSAHQETDEPLVEYMARIQNLVDKSLKNETSDGKQKIAVSAFCAGLLDRQIARLVAVQAKGSVRRALNVAASMNAYSDTPIKTRKYKPDRNSHGYNFYAEEGEQYEAQSAQGDDAYYEQGDEWGGEGDGQEEGQEGQDGEVADDEVCNAVGAPTTRNFGTDTRRFDRGRGGFRSMSRGGSRGGRGRGAPRGRSGPPNGPMRCYKCNGVGHRAEVCPSRFGSGEGAGDSGCWNCGEAGHMSRDCPQAAGPTGSYGTASRTPLAPSATSATSTTTSLYARPNPSVSSALRPATQTASRPPAASVSAAALASGEVQVTMHIVDETPPPTPASVLITDDLLCAGPEAAPHRSLFWTVINIQDRSLWALADTGSSRNLCSETLWNALPALQPPGPTRVLASNSKALDVLGWAVLRMEVAGRAVYHEVGVVRELPVDVIIGGEFMRPHECSLKYADTGRNGFCLGAAECEKCTRNRERLRLEGDAQLTTRFPRRGPSSPLVLAAPEVHNVKMTPLVEKHQSKLVRVLQELKISELDVEDDIKHRLVEIIERCLDAFAADANDVGYTHVVEHCIRLKDGTPVKLRVRPLPYAVRDFVDKEIDRLLELEIIAPADLGNCPFASPIVVVRKKDGTWRMCVDYRRLNDQTDKDRFPLPRIDEIFSSLGRARSFAALDLLMGYHQVAIRAEDRPKTAFITHRGLFVFNRMPFGLTNAPATFQRLMNTVFAADLEKTNSVYLDDLLLYALNNLELLPVIEKTLHKIIDAGLKCKPDKCRFFPKKLPFLGHVLEDGHIEPDQSKLDRIRDWPFPRTGLEVLSFLGLCGYYRRFIDGYADESRPLYDVAQDKVVVPTAALERAFAKVKDMLCTTVAMHLPDPRADFILETDASMIAVGAVLKQTFDGLERPVSFYSQALSKSEKNYSTYERELYAVVRAIESFHVYLLGREFLLRTDHRALMGLFSSSLQTSSRVVKWVMRLQPYTFRIEIIPGKENIPADALSRIPWRTVDDATSATLTETTPQVPQPPLLEATFTFFEEEEQPDDDDVCFADVPALDRNEFANAQREDDHITCFRQWLETQHTPSADELAGHPPFVKALQDAREHLAVEDDLVVWREPYPDCPRRVLVPNALIESVIASVHDGIAAHEGIDKTCARLSRYFYWPGMRGDIKLYIAACPTCDKFRNAPRNARSPLHPIRVAARGEIVAMDVMGGKESLLETARHNRYILTVVDLFTKYLVAIPLPNQLATTVGEAFLHHWVLIFGAPMRLLTDRGLNFESAVIANLCTMWRIDKVRTTAYHPAGNGACERVNQTIKHGLAKTLNERQLEKWDSALPSVVFAYNTSTHTTTGFTPQLLMMGSEARVPSEVLIGSPDLEKTPAAFAYHRVKKLELAYAAVRENLTTRQRRAKALYDLGATARVFTAGDHVRIRLKSIPKSGGKLLSKWSDIYEVVATRGVVVDVRDPQNGTTQTVHADRLSNVTPHLREEHATDSFELLEPDDVVVEPPSVVVAHPSISNVSRSRSNSISRSDSLSRLAPVEPNLDSSDSVAQGSVEPGPSRMLDFLQAARAPGKRVPRPVVDSDYDYNLCIVDAEMSDQPSNWTPGQHDGQPQPTQQQLQALQFLLQQQQAQAQQAQLQGQQPHGQLPLPVQPAASATLRTQAILAQARLAQQQQQQQQLQQQPMPTDPQQGLQQQQGQGSTSSAMQPSQSAQARARGPYGAQGPMTIGGLSQPPSPALPSFPSLSPSMMNLLASMPGSLSSPDMQASQMSLRPPSMMSGGSWMTDFGLGASAAASMTPFSSGDAGLDAELAQMATDTTYAAVAHASARGLARGLPSAPIAPPAVSITSAVTEAQTVMGPPHATAPRMSTARLGQGTSSTSGVGRGFVTLNDIYQIYDQDLRVVRNGGIGFIHRRTGTIYEYVQPAGRFVTQQGIVYTDFNAPEGPDDTSEFDALHPHVTLRMPDDASLLQPVMYRQNFFYDRDVWPGTARDQPVPSSPPRPAAMALAGMASLKRSPRMTDDPSTRPRSAGTLGTGYFDLTQDRGQRPMPVTLDWSRINDPLYMSELQQHLPAGAPRISMSELGQALGAARQLRGSGTTRTTTAMSMRDVLDEVLRHQTRQHELEQERRRQERAEDMRLLMEQMERAHDREREAARQQFFDMENYRRQQALRGRPSPPPAGTPLGPPLAAPDPSAPVQAVAAAVLRRRSSHVHRSPPGVAPSAVNAPSATDVPPTAGVVPDTRAQPSHTPTNGAGAMGAGSAMDTNGQGADSGAGIDLGDGDDLAQPLVGASDVTPVASDTSTATPTTALGGRMAVLGVTDSARVEVSVTRTTTTQGTPTTTTTTTARAQTETRRARTVASVFGSGGAPDQQKARKPTIPGRQLTRPTSATHRSTPEPPPPARLPSPGSAPTVHSHVHPEQLAAHHGKRRAPPPSSSETPTPKVTISLHGTPSVRLSTESRASSVSSDTGHPQREAAAKAAQKQAASMEADKAARQSVLDEIDYADWMTSAEAMGMSFEQYAAARPSAPA
ncbi:MAG: hypothetical protein FD144_5878, partial [Rhodospirillaceae bacterium]